MLASTLNFELVSTPGVVVADRASFDQVAGDEISDGEIWKQYDYAFDDTRLFDPAESAVLGRYKGLEVAVVGGFQEAAGRIRMVANFVEVETGLVIEAVRVEGSTGEEHHFEIQDRLAEELLEALPRIREKLRPQEQEPSAEGG
ncbi:MAG: hypothetical protein ACOCVR_00940, partial [Myxococcota bacterium]